MNYHDIRRGSMLRAALNCAAFISGLTMIWMVSGCARRTAAVSVEQSCVSKAISDGWALETAGYETRVAVSHVSEATDHSQIQVNKDGHWIFVTSH